MSKEQMEEEKDEILSNFKKTPRPEAPKDYFKNFQTKMLNEVTPEDKKKKVSPPKPVQPQVSEKEENTDAAGSEIQFNIKYLYYTIGVAAAVALVFFAVKNLDFGGSKEAPAQVVETPEVVQEDTLQPYIEYVEDHLTDYTTEEIIDVLADNEDFTVEQKVDLTEVSSSDVENYVLDAYDDIEEEIIDEL
ncbi:MAG: hypothetical protein R2799_14800 [Crocinitomicaceae bacterium]